MTVRRDFWEGVNDKSKIKFFPASAINPILVTFLHPEQKEIWTESFDSYNIKLLEFMRLLEEKSTKYNIFGVWPGKNRSDTFPLNREVVRTLCEMNSNLQGTLNP